MNSKLNSLTPLQFVLVIMLAVAVCAAAAMLLYMLALLVLFSLNTIIGTQYPYDTAHAFALMVLLTMLAVFRWYKPE